MQNSTCKRILSDFRYPSQHSLYHLSIFIIYYNIFFFNNADVLVTFKMLAVVLEHGGSTETMHVHLQSNGRATSFP